MAMIGTNWQCPFCSHFQVLTKENFFQPSTSVGTPRNKHSVRVQRTTAIECVNKECREITLVIEFGNHRVEHGSTFPGQLGERKFLFPLRPHSIAKPQHASVPGVLVKDYEEACAIVSASPKASATLARRCLQGMVRHFCSISLPTLHAEIEELKRQVKSGEAPRQVSDESVAAIDAVRQLGNIGAHFEKDINLIVEVEPEEATALIALIELLFKEWYVARHDRQARLSHVTAIATAKKKERETLRANAAQLSPEPPSQAFGEEGVAKEEQANEQPAE